MISGGSNNIIIRMPLSVAALATIHRTAQAQQAAQVDRNILAALPAHLLQQQQQQLNQQQTGLAKSTGYAPVAVAPAPSTTLDNSFHGSLNSSLPSSDSSTVEGKGRRRLTQDETALLAQYFRQNPRPTVHERLRLSQVLNLSERTVQIWFQNKRAKVRKETAVVGPAGGNGRTGTFDNVFVQKDGSSEQAADAVSIAGDSASECAVQETTVEKQRLQHQLKLRKAVTLPAISYQDESAAVMEHGPIYRDVLIAPVHPTYQSWNGKRKHYMLPVSSESTPTLKFLPKSTSITDIDDLLAGIGSNMDNGSFPTETSAEMTMAALFDDGMWQALGATLNSDEDLSMLSPSSSAGTVSSHSSGANSRSTTPSNDAAVFGSVQKRLRTI
jgi:hypothetical protein